MRSLVTYDSVQSAHFCPPPAFSQRRAGARTKAAHALGLRYEKKAQEFLCSLSPWYMPGPWIIYIKDGKPHWCQPDGLHFDLRAGIITIVEIKHAHTPEAYSQLRGLYSPVVKRMFPYPSWGQRLVEVCRWFDPDVRVPEPVQRIESPFAHKGPGVGVFQWRP